MGKYTWPSSGGANYKGGFVMDSRHGEGKITAANGDSIEGEYVNNRLEGAVRLTFPTEGKVYDGIMAGGFLQ